MKTKMTAIFGTLMIALMLTGLAYAHWSQTLYISGTIKTGKLLVGLSNLGVNDNGPDPGFDTETNEQVWYDKDVGSITSENEGYIFENGTVKFYEKEVITINNAYPSYAPGWCTIITNGGTIPVKISNFVVTPDVATWPKWIELLKWIIIYEWGEVANGASHPITSLEYYGDECFSKLLEALVGQQLEPGGTIIVYIDLHTTQEFGPMPMNATFSFSVEVTFTQWNMVP